MYHLKDCVSEAVLFNDVSIALLVCFNYKNVDKLAIYGLTSFELYFYSMTEFGVSVISKGFLLPLGTETLEQEKVMIRKTEKPL